MAKHTPGPWRSLNNCVVTHSEHFGIAIVDPTPDEDFWCGDSEPVNNQEEYEANARLIAAAPELLEALVELTHSISEHVKFDVRKHYSLMVCHVAAQKAIEKATGG